MTDTTEMTEMIDPVMREIIDQRQLAEQLLAQAKAQRMSLVGPGGLLSGLTKPATPPTAGRRWSATYAARASPTAR